MELLEFFLSAKWLFVVLFLCTGAVAILNWKMKSRNRCGVVRKVCGRRLRTLHISCEGYFLFVRRELQSKELSKGLFENEDVIFWVSYLGCVFLSPGAYPVV